MNQPITGIHHITALATDPQKNIDFYTGVLGLRLVKKTVNFDDPGTYHLYYGDELGRPGTILTFFPWPMARRGSRGAGQATVTSFSVSADALGFWVDRLDRYAVVAEEPKSRFEEEVIAFYDPDGMKLELVAHADADEIEPWTTGPVPGAHAIRGFHSVTLAERDVEETIAVLTEVMGLRPTAQSEARFRFESAADGPGRRVDVLHTPKADRGRIAAGTVHHVAWRVADELEQATWRQRFLEAGPHPTEALDRQYFKSIYFREPGGVLFELATDPPGFTRDEASSALGTELKLPPWLEPHRERIERALPPVTTPTMTMPTATIPTVAAEVDA